MSSPAICAALAEELVAYLDGEQPEPERARIEAHVGTCLTCRRELERLRRTRILLGALPLIEPSADFHDGMWRRLDATPSPRRRGYRRAVVWGAPALAAAAALALVWYSSVARVTTDGRGARGAVASRPAGGTASGESRVVTRHQAVPGTDTAHDVAVAGSDLDEYPPELIEHPELFLRYPVVRRLQKLQHFEEVRQHEEGEPLGSAPHERTIG